MSWGVLVASPDPFTCTCFHGTTLKPVSRQPGRWPAPGEGLGQGSAAQVTASPSPGPLHLGVIGVCRCAMLPLPRRHA